MKILLAIILFCLICTSSNSQVSDTAILTKQHLTDGSYHVVFVDKRSNSPFLSRVFGTDINKDELSLLLNKAKDSFSVSHYTGVLKRIPKNWAPVYAYKQHRYLYSPSEGGELGWLQINDSAVIEACFDPPVLASLIQSAEAINDNQISIKINNTAFGKQEMIIHIIDENNGIAVFEWSSNTPEYRYRLMIDQTKASRLPLIVNYNKDSKMMEWEFDKLDYSKILKTRKL